MQAHRLNLVVVRQMMNVEARTTQRDITLFVKQVAKGLAQLIFGVRKATGGSVEIDGEPVTLHSPREAIQHGIGFLTENRKEQGL